MERIRLLTRRLRSDQLLMKRLYLITLGAALFTLVLVMKGPEDQGRLVTGSNGDIVSIERHSLTTSESYDVTVKVGTGPDAAEEDVTIELRSADTGRAASQSKENGVSRESEYEAEIDRMLSELEYSDEENVDLPRNLADGTPVVWKARKQEDRTGLIFIPFIYLTLAALAVKSSIDRNDDGEARAREEIMKGLPRFCNQLFLMMNAGMILSDAFEMICLSYREYGEENMSVFEKELSDLLDESDGHRVSTAALLSEYAARHNVKEMVRIAAILTENERRGSDVIESLSRESSYLWDDRKIVAREKGKMIDMKMSWPLAMLLILLIVITMAPALLGM